ncbi:TA system VapC family ribonuclease toxin [Nocardia arizonensis]|uniref:TA system VapC family ribonuclease toxin n=1 Tax=Nocardia arizonensis TaxID=1141647 RepID=UPI0006D0EAE6|nr:TA system VapC family ribonuclease toxin [Nocardia arizonensis]
MTLIDVGVWLAAIWGRHVHHKIAAEWLDRQSDNLLLCRVAQTGLLRLLSNPAVMGTDVLTRAAAWRIIDQLSEDERVLWSDEPAELGAVFRAFSAKDDKSHKLWTDDYLAAFAQTSRAALATFDRRLATRYPSVHVVTL